VEQALRQVPEPYRTSLILRDLEEMSYDEIAEVLAISLGTVKSRITRGRAALRKTLTGYVREVGPELGLAVPSGNHANDRAPNDRPLNEGTSGNTASAGSRQSVAAQSHREGSRGGREAEVTP
jgi:hypothetical protein